MINCELKCFMWLEKWSENWQLLDNIFFLEKVKILCQRLFLEYFKLFEFNWLDFGGSQLRANILALRIKFPKKLNATEIESWCFYIVFLMYTHWWLIVGYSCWWAPFIHDFANLSHSIESNLNVCPRSLMTLTTFLRIFFRKNTTRI